MMVGTLQMLEGVAAQERLTLAKILTGLQTRGTTPETNTLAKRNLYIQRQVEERGVNFVLTADRAKDLRDAGASVALLNAIRQNGPNVTTPTPTPSSRPRAVFKDLWVDYDVTEGSQKGMRIHAKFTAYGMRGMASYLAIYFQDQYGTALPNKSGNSSYNSSDNKVAVYREMTPGYDPADYDDFIVFMPYDELDLGRGTWNLRMDVKIIYKAGGLISQLTTKDFQYSNGSNTQVPNTENVTANVKRVWVDYNITQGGVRGMRVHVNFDITGLQGVDSRLVIRIRKVGGDYLTNSGSAYANVNGEFQTEYKMKPGYPTTVYSDASVFIPYDQVIIGRGRWNLEFDIDLAYGDEFTHLKWEPFSFTRN